MIAQTTAIAADAPRNNPPDGADSLHITGRVARPPEVRFGIGFKIGKAADVVLIEEDLRYGFNRLTDSFFQIGFGDAFRVDVHIAEVEVIALFGQFLSQLFRAHTVRAPWTTKNYCKHFSLLKKQA